MRTSIWKWLGLGLALFAASFAYTYSRWTPVDQAGDTPMEERLQAHAAMTLRYILPDGRRGADVTGTLPPELVGTTLSELQREKTDWSVLRFAADEVVAEVRCAPVSGGFLGEKDGYIAVYEGQPGPCSALRELTDIPAQDIPFDERERLKTGITFRDDNEKQELLDALLGD